MPLAVVLRQGQMVVATDRAVLRADDVRALEDAGELLRFTQEESQRMHAEIKAQGQALELTLREAARVSLEESTARAVADVHVKAAALMRDVETTIAQTVMDAVMKVTAHVDRAAIHARSLQEVRRLVDERQIAVLKVSPSDLALVTESVRRMIDAAQLPATFTVRAEATLVPGNCVLHSAAGRYKFGVSSMMGALAQSLQAWLRESHMAAAPDRPAAGEARAPAGVASEAGHG